MHYLSPPPLKKRIKLNLDVRLERIGKPLTLQNRFAIGMLLAATGVFVAGLVETYRLVLVDNDHIVVQYIGTKKLHAADMTLFW